MKQLIGIHRSPPPHWVGDGFPVSTVFSHQEQGLAVSPFLMFDYASPTPIAPSDRRLGVGAHPHKGFETVTIVFQGELEHHDSTGSRGHIGPGDVQWMTAGRGIVHAEYHAEAFARSGGTLEMAQLWVNLPARHKEEPAGYQSLLDAAIPRVELTGGYARVVAGSYDGVGGAARTFTPLNLWDLRLDAGSSTVLPVPDRHAASLFMRRGRLESDGHEMSELDLAVFDRSASGIEVQVLEDAEFLVLSGEPIDEPIAAYGPFVMNTRAEIEGAIEEYRSGAMGVLP